MIEFIFSLLRLGKGMIDVDRLSATFLDEALLAKKTISPAPSGFRCVILPLAACPSVHLYLVSPSLVVPWARSQTNETRERGGGEEGKTEIQTSAAASAASDVLPASEPPMASSMSPLLCPAHLSRK